MRESWDAKVAEGGMLASVETRGNVAVFKKLCGQLRTVDFGKIST
jgi:hypothetical protein